MLPEWFLEVVRCPLEKTPLQWLSAEELERFNQAIEQGKLRNRAGEVVRERLAAALINETRTCVYPVSDGIADLILDDALDPASLEG